MEDYLQMLLQMLEFAPDILFPSAAFPVSFKAAMAALTLVQADVVFAGLDFISNVITHDCLLPPAGGPPPPKFPVYAAVIRPMVEKEGPDLVGYLLSGLTGDFPEESTSTVVTIFRTMASQWPSALLSWLPPVLQQLPVGSVPDSAKTQFMTDMTRYVFLR